MIKPLLSFSIYDFKSMVGRPLKEISSELKDITDACGMFTQYTYANQHLYLSSIDGKDPVAFMFLVFNDHITVWAEHGAANLICLCGDIFSQKMFDLLHEMLIEYASDKMRCPECGLFYNKNDQDKWKKYSFAGIVCHKCYKPQAHCSSDT